MCVVDNVTLTHHQPYSHQLVSGAKALVKVGPCDDQGESGVDGGEMLDECSGK